MGVTGVAVMVIRDQHGTERFRQDVRRRSQMRARAAVLKTAATLNDDDLESYHATGRWADVVRKYTPPPPMTEAEAAKIPWWLAAATLLTTPLFIPAILTTIFVPALRWMVAVWVIVVWATHLYAWRHGWLRVGAFDDNTLRDHYRRCLRRVMKTATARR